MSVLCAALAAEMACRVLVIAGLALLLRYNILSARRTARN